MYWKWMWSMMRRPGERRMEIAAAWAARLLVVVESMNLRVSVSVPSRQAITVSRRMVGKEDAQLEGVGEQQLRDDDGGALEVDGLPAVVAEVVDAQHGAVDEAGDVGEDPLEVGEEGRVVEGPLGGALEVPLAEGQAVGDGEPVAVDLEVGGLAGGC